MDIKVFLKYFIKYAYKKYIYTVLAVLFFRYGLGFTFCGGIILFEIILALFIYDLPAYLKFKHFEANKITKYRDLIEIFTSILSNLCKSYGINLKKNRTLITNVGYYTPENVKEITNTLDKVAKNKENVDFKAAKLCNKDFQSLQYIHSSYFESFCCDEDLKEDFLLTIGNITKMDRDVDLILNLTNPEQQLDCIDNFHLQVRNICDEINIFYEGFFYEVEKNIPINKNGYINNVIGGSRG